jgi:hypothetical protein
LRTIAGSRPARWLRASLLPAVIGRDRSARLSDRMKRSRAARTSATREPVSAELRAALETELAADVAKLSEMLGRDMHARWFARRAT